MDKFQSNYADSPDDLLRMKNDAWINQADKKNRLKTVRQFTNMLKTMTDAEAAKLGRTEITNHGLTHRDMLQQETQFTSMVTVTNSLLEVVVDTDNPEEDTTTGLRISEAINRYAIHNKGKFANFWRKCAGELVIAGGCAVTQNEKYGWLPDLRPDMFFPKETSLDTDQVPFAFDPKELTIDDLKKMSAAVKGDSSRFIDKATIDTLIAKIEEQVKEGTKDAGSSFVEETSESVRAPHLNDRSESISAYWFYETKYEKNGDPYVSSTLWVDSVNSVDFEKTGANNSDGSATIIAYIDKAYDEANDWLHLVTVDSEIGGVKNMDTLRGVAEMVYPSALEMEELLNLTMEGDKIRARPKVKLLDNADADAVAQWDIVQDAYAPAGVEEMQFKGDSRSLMTPFSLLSQNAAGMAGGAVSNGPDGGELRQQAVERQRNSAMLQTNRVGEAYNHLEAILETVVWRVLAGPIKPGTDGYREIKAIRDKLDFYEIDYKGLAKRKHGMFQFLRVRARRSIGNGDRQQQLETADWLMENIQNYAPGVRPRIIHKATILRTQDPDEADDLVKVPQTVINTQKVTAENEYDTISRRAALGQTLPVSDDDIHQDHIPVHLVDMQAHIARHSIRPWDMLDVMTFAGMTEHVGEHLKILMSNPVTNAEGAAFIQDYQNITQAAQAIVAEVEEASGQQDQQNQMDPEKQAKLELEAEKVRQSGIKLGMSMQEADDLRENREARESLAQRSQYTKEINDDRRLKLDNKRINAQALAQKKQTEKE